MQDLSSAVKYVPTDFPELRRLVAEKGLFNKQPVYFTIQWIIGLGLLAVNVTVLFSFDSWLVQMLNAVFMAFTFVQFGFLLHDSGHHQVFKSPRWNTGMAHLTAVILGGSAGYWIEKHNAHHAHPNHEEMDPDVDVLILAFSEEQARSKSGIARWIVARQHWFFFPILSLVCISLRSSSVDFVRKNPLKRTWLDILTMIAHVTLYAGVVFWALPPVMAAVFIVVHQLLFGFYMGSVFAPNHKGMLMLTADMKIDFLREQVLTARNIRAHPLTDFVYGGLNYQVEHHLFPHMPRNQLRKAHRIVKEFCGAKEIPYHETSIAQSYREILECMRHISRFAASPYARMRDLRSQLMARLTHLDAEIKSRLQMRFENVIAADDAARLENAARRVADIRTSLVEARSIRIARLQRYMQEVHQLAQSCTLKLATEPAQKR